MSDSWAFNFVDAGIFIIGLGNALFSDRLGAAENAFGADHLPRH
jgi:hypothetical protein